VAWRFSIVGCSKSEDRAMVHACRWIAMGNLQPLAIVLLAPVIIIASALVMIGLLGIFIIWLTVVGALVTAIVISDIMRRTMRRLAPTPAGTLERPAVGVPGR
jgi:hypothetical protein